MPGLQQGIIKQRLNAAGREPDIEIIEQQPISAID
jgi:hypothetical protein